MCERMQRAAVPAVGGAVQSQGVVAEGGVQ